MPYNNERNAEENAIVIANGMMVVTNSIITIMIVHFVVVVALSFLFLSFFLREVSL